MLGKLLSNIANSEETSLSEGLSGKVKRGDGKNGSQQVFQSLLQALQDDGSGDNQQLLRLTDSDGQSESEDDNAKSKILGGASLQTDAEESKVKGPVTRSILERLQQQLKNKHVDAEQSSEASEGSSSEEKVLESGKDILPNEGQEATSGKVEDKDQEVRNTIHPSENKEETTNNTDQKTGQTEESKQADNQLTENQADVVTDGDGEDSLNNVEQAKTKAVDEHQSSESRAARSEQKASITADTDADKNVEGRIRVGESNSAEQVKETKTESEDKASKQSGNNKKQVQQVAATQSEKTQSHPKENIEQKIEEAKQRESRELNIDSDNKQKINRQAASLGDKITDVPRSNTSEVPGSTATETKSKKEQDEQPLTRDRNGAKTELKDQQKKVIDSFFRKSTTASDKGFEIKNMKAEKDQKKTKENADNEKGLGSISKSRDRLFNQFSILNTENSGKDKSFSTQSFSGVSAGDSQVSMEEKIVWEKHSAETVEADDEKEMKMNNASGSARLGQMPITNASLRQKILPGLTQSVQKAADGAKKSPGDWQKHNFVLDDGKKIQLSVRESKGVLQVKMGSMNSDLSKLLQQNLQQIRDHLKQEFGSDIDLQFENHDQEEESVFSDSSETSDQKRNYRDRLSGNEVTSEHPGEVANTTVRNFGYNQMEWTA